jgi:hypothetical protein
MNAILSRNVGGLMNTKFLRARVGVLLVIATSSPSMMASQAIAGSSYGANGQKQLFWRCVKTASAGTVYGGSRRWGAANVDFTRDPAIFAACKYIHTFDGLMCVKSLRVSNMGQKLTAFTRVVARERVALDPHQVAGCGGV